MNAVLVSTSYFGIPDLAAVTLRHWIRRDKALDGVGFDIVAQPWPEDVKTAAERILEKEPGLVGFTCYIWNVNFLVEIAAEIKRRSPRTLIALGGPEASPLADRYFSRNHQLDFIALGEGEETLRLLLHAVFLKDVAITDVPGLARRENGRIFKTAVAPLIDLDLAPETYPGRQGPMPKEALLETSRGCPFLCSFCDWGPRKMRYVQLDRLEREFKALAGKSEMVILCDADPFMDQKRGVEVLERFERAAKGTDLRMKIDTNPVFLTEEIVDIIARRPEGYFLSFGLQSISEAANKRIHRPFDLKRIEANMRDFRKRAAKTRFFFSIIYGLPGDDMDSFRASVDWVLQWRPSNFIAPRLLMLPGADMVEEAHHPKLIYSPDPPYQVHQTDAMSREDLAAARELAVYGEVLYNTQAYSPSPVDVLFGGEFAAETMAPGERVRHLEGWIAHVKAAGLACVFGSPFPEGNELEVRTYVAKARERLAANPLDLAALMRTTTRYVEGRSRVAAPRS